MSLTEEGNMRCNRCESDNVAVLESGPHKKLVCQDCYSFIKFLSAAEYKIFLAIKAKKEEKANGN
jgi:late competence protein required for DNA uptake (superfamily II DNA/RNA helicase)